MLLIIFFFKCGTNWCWICGDFIDPEWRHYNQGLCAGLQFVSVDSVVEQLQKTFMTSYKERYISILQFYHF